MEKSIILLLGSMLLAAQTKEAGRSFTNATERYRMSVPKDWHVWDVEPNGALSLSSYAPSSALEGGLVPAGEAGIYIMSAWRGIKDLTSWIERDSQDSRRIGEKKIVIQGRDDTGVREYTQIETLNETGPGVHYRTIGAYFKFQGRLFRATLEFKDGDPRAGLYRTILNGILRSISPIAAAPAN